MSLKASDNDKPDTPSLAHKRQAEAGKIVRDCAAGPLRIRAEGKAYLRQFPREDPDDYNERLNSSVFYDWFSRTVQGLTGLVFRESPEFAEDTPKPIVAAWENLDLLGTHGDIFLQERHEDGEIDGHFVVFVDMSASLRRPYAIGIQKQDVLEGSETLVDGVPTLTHFRYRTSVVERVGKYGQRKVEQVREYNLMERPVEGDVPQRFVECVVHVKREREGEEPRWEEASRTAMEIDEIPATAGYHGKRLGPFESRPAHLGLAMENRKHYELVSDNDNVLHLCSVPQFATIGAERQKGEDEISPHTGWDLPQGGDIKYAEPAGNGLAAAERRIDKSEHRMAVMGLSMLQSETKAQETATSKRINKAEQDSALARHARATNDAAEEIVRLMAKWLDIELPKRKGRWFTISTKFGEIPMDAAMIRAYVEMFRAGFPVYEILEALQAMGAIPKTSDLKSMELQMLAAAMVEPFPEDEPEPEPEPQPEPTGAAA